jgi:hypothetical protein
LAFLGGSEILSWKKKVFRFWFRSLFIISSEIEKFFFWPYPNKAVTGKSADTIFLVHKTSANVTFICTGIALRSLICAKKIFLSPKSTHPTAHARTHAHKNDKSVSQPDVYYTYSRTPLIYDKNDK